MKTWIETAPTTSRAWVRRGPGRRASDRFLRLESILASAGLLVWGWCAYELARLVFR